MIQIEIHASFHLEEPFPFILQNYVNEYTWELTKSNSITREIWKSLSLDKHKSSYPSLVIDEMVLTKTSRLISCQNKQEHTNQKNQLRCIQNEFLSKIQKFQPSYPYSLQPPTALRQLYPPPKSIGFFTEAIIPYFLNISVSIISNYFSIMLIPILPLIAYQKNLYGLDFRSCRNSVIFGMIDDNNILNLNHEKIRPVGSVMWRIHKPIPNISTNVSDNETTVGVLEVLFLAVQTESRNYSFGSKMVYELKNIAKNEECKIMYVEIGDETPWAFKFWKSHSLEQI